MGKSTNHGLFFEIGIAAALDFCALVHTSPDASISEPLELLMMECRSRANVATLQCRSLLRWFTQRWDVTTWGRHDVGTSRRWNVAMLHPLSCIAFHYSNFLPKFALFTSFAPAFTEISILRYRAIKIHI